MEWVLSQHLKMNMDKNILTSKKFSKEFIETLFLLTEKIEKGKLDLNLKGKILVNLFFEPSTRTRLGFESAILRLGGNVINIEDINNLAIKRGESLQDTIKMIDKFADVLVIRHFDKDVFKKVESELPIINAGNGEDEHPTQSLLDLYTIKKEIGRVDNFKILFVGDLLYGRTIHSLIYLLSKFRGIKIYFSSSNSLKLPEKFKLENVMEIKDWKEILSEIDVLYTNRIKKERFENKKDYKKAKNFFKINNSVLKKLNENAIIMHPLPRTDEIPINTDKDKRAVYFKQAENGLYIRMALLILLLKDGNH
jgi:aspartate carbamoyltransferase catalytic subunit